MRLLITLLLLLLLLLLSSAVFAQIILYDKVGIRFSYSTTVSKIVFCPKENKKVNFVKARWEVYNYSGKSIYLHFAANMTTNSFIGGCMAEDEIAQYLYQPSGVGGYAGEFKSGDKFYGEDGGWYFQADVTPWWTLTPKALWQGPKVNTPNSNNNTTKQQTKPAYGISQQGDVINNPKPQTDYTQKQKDEDKATAERMKAWQKEGQKNQQQLKQQNNAATKQNQDQIQKQEEFQHKQHALAKAKLDLIRQHAIEQQQLYQQIQIDLDNAKIVSMNAYQEAINKGKKESGAILDATLAGAQQINDPTSSLIYTGIGLGISLFTHLAEKKEERKQKELESQNKGENSLREEERKRLIIETKNKFIKEAVDINKYTYLDLVIKDRYAAILIVPNSLNTDEQSIYFTYPILLHKYSDSTYPLKPDIEKKMSLAVEKSALKDKTIYTLYPITYLEKFNNDFVKKMGSGKVIYLNAEVLNFSKNPFGENTHQNNETDFWGNPIKKEVNKQSSPEKKSTNKSFWNQ